MFGRFSISGFWGDPTLMAYNMPNNTAGKVFYEVKRFLWPFSFQICQKIFAITENKNSSDDLMK